MANYTIYLHQERGGYQLVHVSSDAEPKSNKDWPGWITLGTSQFQAEFVAAIVPDSARVALDDGSSGGVLMVPSPVDPETWAKAAREQQAGED